MKLNRILKLLMLLFATTTLLVQCTPKKDVIAPPANKTPTALAGPDIVITLPVKTVKLNGSASKDTDGTIAKYEWTKITVPSPGVDNSILVTPTKDTTTVTNLVSGNYSFKLTVTDDKGATNSDTVSVTVNPEGSKPPIAHAGAAQTITLPTSEVTLDASASTNADGTKMNLTYKWIYISGGSNSVIIMGEPANPIATVTGLTVADTYTFQLTVTDANKLTHVATVTITVKPAAMPGNKEPIANAGTNQTITLPTSTVKLDGSASKDPDGTIAKYEWAVTGPSGTIKTADKDTTTVTGLTVVGEYLFVLTVTDDKGAINKDTVKVTVNAKTDILGVWKGKASSTTGGLIDLALAISPNMSGYAIKADGSINGISINNQIVNYTMIGQQITSGNFSTPNPKGVADISYDFVGSFDLDFTKYTITSLKLGTGVELLPLGTTLVLSSNNS